MNRSRILVSLFLGLMTALGGALPAGAGYRDLKAAFQTYTPPQYTLAAPPPADSSAAATGREPEASPDFAAVREAIRERKEKWKRRLSHPGAADAFFKPESETWQTLAPLRHRPEETARLMNRPFGLETLETLTLVRAPEIRAAEASAKAALAAFDQVANLEATLRQYSAFTEGVMPGVGPMKGEPAVDKRFPFPGVLSLKGEIAALEVEAAAENLAIARRSAITRARQSFWDLVYTGEAIAVTREMLALLGNLEAVAKTRYEAGAASFQDVIRIRIQKETLEEELVTLTEKGNNLKTGLKALLDLPPAAGIAYPAARVPGGQTPPLEALYRQALLHRQELALLRVNIAKMERMIQMAETMILPGYTLGTAYFAANDAATTGSGAGGPAFSGLPSAARGAGLPKMPWYGKDDAYLRETRQKLVAMRQNLEQLEADTRTLVRNAWFELDRAAREAGLYRARVVALSKTALEVATRGYESGQVSFADVFGAYSSWLSANLTAGRKTSDLGIARAELGRVLGRSLETLE